MSDFEMDPILPLSEAHILAIGRVTAYFSLIESGANILVAEFLGLESREDATSLTAHMMFSVKVQLLKTLVSTRFEGETELKTLIDELLCDMESANKSRNRIVHAQWYYYSPKNNKSGALRQTARGSIKTSLQGFTPEEINRVAGEMIVVYGKFQRFLMKKNGFLSFR
ncbi:hypothetical protein [Thioalbus denitrificans]|uniref:hypothetical protein n=1 Tax=Thioalbus denitrificans TaxID=547122 RepID=UPI0011C02D63|nr:hypothetical protein [Thioalbus denitrificans]